MIEQTEQFGTHECRRWRAMIFRAHPALAGDLARGFLDRARAAGIVYDIDGNRAGNTWLRECDDRLTFGTKLSATLDDDEIQQRAELCAQAVAREFSSAAGNDMQKAIERARWRVERYGIAWPAKITKRDSAEQQRDKHLGAVARASDALWWRRQLRKVAGRKVEGFMREAGRVHRRAGLYVSDWMLARWRAAQQRNADTLSRFDAVTDGDDGDEIAVPLADCVAASVANPENRRNELMTRMRGWEEVAAALLLRGALLTLTAPSKYHPILHAGGRNPKFNGADPRAAMAYLNAVWARIRAAWQRADIRAFGFRITEPHHDGTPHNHFLLFFAADQIEKAWAIFREHALAEDGDEPGAEKYRCDRADIDPAKGTAAGYVAKYVSKNIDGAHMGDDAALDGIESAQAREAGKAQRVRAWASCWGIRQFQQIGAVSVTVYRELRRLTDPLTWEPAEVEAARLAADAGDWAKFVEIMGGGFVERAAQLLRPLYADKDKPGRYGEAIKRLAGLALGRALQGYAPTFCAQWTLETREKIWRIVEARLSGSGEGLRQQAQERARALRVHEVYAAQPRDLDS
jgi:hypothetical protein